MGVSAERPWRRCRPRAADGPAVASETRVVEDQGSAMQSEGDRPVSPPRPTDQGPGLPRVERPARPDLSSPRPPPATGDLARPRVVRRLLGGLQAAVSLLGFAALTMFLTRSSLTGYLTELLSERDSGVAETRIAAATPNIVRLAVAVLICVALVEGLVLRGVNRSRRWPLWVMPLVALFHVAVVLVSLLLVPRETWQGWLLSATLVAGALVAVYCVGALLSPGVRHWLGSGSPEEGVLTRDHEPVPGSPPASG
jgi:hypothetical protein